MLYSQSPPLADNDAARQNSPRGFARDQEARSEPRFGGTPASASIHTLALPRPRPSVARRMLRAVTRFVMAVLIGVGATLGWQAYGDTTKQMLSAHAPELAPLLAWLPAKAPAVVATPASPALQLEPLATNLEFVRRSVDQMALKQEQIIRNVAALQAVDEEIRQKVSQPPPAPAQPVAATTPQPKSAPPKPQAPPRPSASAAPVPLAPSR